MVSALDLENRMSSSGSSMTLNLGGMQMALQKQITNEQALGLGLTT